MWATGVILPSLFDDKEFEDLTIEEIANGPPEYGEWNGRPRKKR